MMRRWALAIPLLALMGCNDLSSFDTAEGEAYCGAVTLASNFRTGFSPRVQMRMTFRGSAVEASTSPGHLTTFDPEAGQQLLQSAPLRPIVPLQNDDLALLQFGEGRDKNLIYAVSPTTPEAESLLAVVSLRSDDRIEVRLLRPGASEAANTEGRRQLFGLFTLDRREGDCGF